MVRTLLNHFSLSNGFVLTCSSLACRISGSIAVKVEAVSLEKALANHQNFLKCGEEMKGKNEIRQKR